MSEQADPTVGVGSQALPIPMKDCGSKFGESGGLVDGDRSSRRPDNSVQSTRKLQLAD